VDNIKSRFAALDGLRAIAALGVLWIHTWTFHHNPRLFVKRVDIASILALGGNGVDLFFVISGFCMYYFYAKNKNFSYTDFWSFIKKRWIRLSPAFYTACLVYAIFNVNNGSPSLFIKIALTSLTYLGAIFPGYTPENILWSLTPEWQFYIIIPFLLIYQRQFGFKKTFLVITFCLLIIALISIVLLKSQSDYLGNQIVFRYFQFMWGILVGKILSTWPQLKLKYRIIYFLAFVIITYAGRILISKPILSLSKDYYNLFKLLGFTIMAAGFSGIIYMVLTSKKWLKMIFGNAVLSFIGKISFSFYLWHALIFPQIGKRVMMALPNVNNIALPLLTFSISVIILVPLSAASFYLLEKNFMARTNPK
jgi:peptidoglycan/LPS O-acetylase OafA/YrhL